MAVSSAYVPSLRTKERPDLASGEAIARRGIREGTLAGRVLAQRFERLRDGRFSLG